VIKAIVFDLDGMLFLEPHFFTKELEIKYGILLKDSLFSKDKTYDECKKGNITLDEFLRPYYNKWKKYSLFNLTLEDIKKEWFEFTKLQNEVFEIAKRLEKNGIINLILTNNVRERTDYLDEKYNLNETFKIVGSPDLGEMKPNKKFNQVLKDKYGLETKDVLYYDDKEKTIRELKKQGFDARLYQGVENFRKELHKLKLL
jgi:FMN phosphatase YigB (HAD superfamily)